MKVTVTIEVPDPRTGKTAFPFGVMQVRTPLFRATGLQTQWPVAMLEVGDAPVRVYHSDNTLGFELQDGTRWALLLSDMARQVVAATAPICIGNSPPPPEV